MTRLATCCLLAVGLAMMAGCDLSMDRQQRHQTQSSPTLWPGGPAALASPDGTVAADDPPRQAALANPPPVTLALLERGRERYTIYCAPCHGGGGAGDGIVVQRGFPRPAPLGVPRLRAAPAAYLVDVIGNGYGAMYGFSDRIGPADRWAIAGYVRVLQRAAP